MTTTDGIGEALTLSDRHVTVDLYPAAGGRIGQISVGGRSLLKGPEHASGWAAWGSYPMLPWSNRIPGGKVRVGESSFDVPVNWPDGSAIHGLAATRPWTVTASGPRHAELVVEIDEAGYRIAAVQQFALTPSALVFDVSLTNVGRESVPAGLGIHPWFAEGSLFVPAELAWDGDGPLPTGTTRPVGPDDDLRQARPAPPMDRCYAGLTGSACRIGDVWLRWNGPITHVVVYTREDGWVCVEPTTMANDGFRLLGEGHADTGVVVLEPNSGLAVTYVIEW